MRFYDPLKRASEFVGALVDWHHPPPVRDSHRAPRSAHLARPVIYKQVRVGEKGREFTLYKFRTMRVDAEKNGAQWASQERCCARRRSAASSARRTSTNCPSCGTSLRGDLSFVGPRPERPEFVKQLAARIPYYEARLFIKPGVTGWAQIHHRADLTDAGRDAKTAIRHLLFKKPLADPRLGDRAQNVKINLYQSRIIKIAAARRTIICREACSSYFYFFVFTKKTAYVPDVSSKARSWIALCRPCRC